ncbi:MULTISPECIES: hypothetical protein [Rhizobium/Agrobacterium group]|uniref:Uncharacterized protein n=2 Tax=Neorhizobium TaxID=1525371 RepID=A0ABV0MB94_9HYPH|nr:MULTISPECIES: hypothetical protein [Rhizobium/Agrobacterium group]KGD94313.1 hypothetical protein JL39_20825 [Rhizobium sp. YS-1r]MCC2609837.1 hypothetical protein [Neorhizobium petrolearium]WGI70023.1 hypothetical protein QEO92_08270 [Neorhizobium petrolearium]
MNNQGLWLKVTRSDGVNLLVNFDQVVAILPHEDGQFTKLVTAAGDIPIKENIDYIQAHISI